MEKTRRILDAALNLFVEFGFHATPTSKIAEMAGVSNGTLFNKFKTKDELIVALYVDIKTRMFQYIIDNSTASNSYKEKLKNQFLITLYWALDNKNAFLFVEQFKTSPFLSLIAPEEIEKSIQPFYSLIQAGIDNKQICEHDIDYIFMLISSHTYGLNQYLLKNNFPKAKQHQIINDTFEILWRMLN